MAIEFFPANEVYVGRDMGGRRTVITAADVERYTAGTGDQHAWAGGASPFREPVAPALLLHSEVYRDLSWYLPNLIGNLHARQEWQLFAPLPLDQPVRTRATIVERYRKRNREYVVNEVLVTDDDGRWLQRSRTHQSFLIEDPSGALVIDKDRERRPERRFTPPEGGTPLADFRRVVTLEMCEAFSGPVRNYHTDREMAQALGFPDVVVQGMLSICLISELMTGTFGAGWLCGGALDVNLTNVLWGGEAVTTCGRIREETPEGARTRVLVDVWCAKDDGTPTIIGTASAVR